MLGQSCYEIQGLRHERIYPLKLRGPMLSQHRQVRIRAHILLRLRKERAQASIAATNIQTAAGKWNCRVNILQPTSLRGVVFTRPVRDPCTPTLKVGRTALPLLTDDAGMTAQGSQVVNPVNDRVLSTVTGS